jgi:hypothetical protein
MQRLIFQKSLPFLILAFVMAVLADAAPPITQKERVKEPFRVSDVFLKNK